MEILILIKKMASTYFFKLCTLVNLDFLTVDVLHQSVPGQDIKCLFLFLWRACPFTCQKLAKLFASEVTPHTGLSTRQPQAAMCCAWH